MSDDFFSLQRDGAVALQPAVPERMNAMTPAYLPGAARRGATCRTDAQTRRW